MHNSTPKKSNTEFICLMATLMSLAALSIDAMLPAFSQISVSLNVIDFNDTQLIVSSVFLGMSLGLMIYGPLSDSIGRKKTFYIGVSIYLVGVLISIYASNLDQMLFGRVIQGFGVASCRVVGIAMVRDNFEGPAMGRIMSLISVVFIMVPALAPSLGQGILLVAEWQMIFWFIFMFGLGGLLWLYLRQPESLAIENRIPFSFRTLRSGMLETVKHKEAFGYTVSLGLIFGTFVAYLSSAQQILQVQYGLGDLFSIYFGALALALGLSSYANSKLIAVFGMIKLCFVALLTITLISAIFYFYMYLNRWDLSLNLFLAFLMITFFCLGLLFGNLNSLSMQPFGHIAGVATSVITSIQTLLAVVVGGAIGQLYDGTVGPLIAGFLVCGAVTLIIFIVSSRKNPICITIDR